ncbi:hypothetical protein SAMN05444483_102336 [Salegentibacter echinorum]|uniref:Uncharacterized protein n=1 Tax=Salegentibacter echinorum TaxID=1073325 RepID=A0A1M5EE34_SALEC|nr:hypothetical protein [Salegentibacter echinorum]SHF77394.1 hypothetical protein SAMN05444483_102336 [Salegentibacter echinorum]
MSKLREHSRTDLFDASSIADDLVEFKFDYFFTGKRTHKKSHIIDFFVVTWVMDAAENLFIRYCNYYGDGKTWKMVVEKQMRELMADISVGATFITSELRFFEVEKEKHLPVEKFEQKFLDLKAKMKSNH